MKRDDQTGLVLGGNKARKLEFLIGEALDKECDIVVTTGGSQSNHARMTAGACRMAGLDCYLVLDRGRHPENGNFLLDQMLGAEVEVIEDSDPEVAAARMEEVAGQMTSKGRRPYVIPRGGSVPTGAVGYAQMVFELQDQLGSAAVSVDRVYVPTGSCGTHAGIMAGRRLAGVSWRVQGISVSRPSVLQEPKVFELANAVLDHLGTAERVDVEDVRVDDSYRGEAYGVPTEGMWRAVSHLSACEGILIDPVYTGKAMAGLLDHVAGGTIRQGERVLFIHTGGAPALFGYAPEIPARNSTP